VTIKPISGRPQQADLKPVFFRTKHWFSSQSNVYVFRHDNVAAYSVKLPDAIANSGRKWLQKKHT
jgi:hypothetical protein